MTDFVVSMGSIVSIAAPIGVMAGTWLKVRKVLDKRQKDKALERALILQEAKEFSNRNKRIVEARLEALEKELENAIQNASQKIENRIEILYKERLAQVEAIHKDLDHLKDSYNNELKFLGSKIEELKDELRSSLGQVVTLVSKLIDKA